jgi:hypothetical protein
MAGGSGRIGMFHSVAADRVVRPRPGRARARGQAALAGVPADRIRTVTATSTAAFALATATAADDCANSGTLVVSAAAEGPITTAELIRRGCDDELEARALDVVLRCGWPRPDVDLTTGPCIPVPVEILHVGEYWRHELTSLALQRPGPAAGGRFPRCSRYDARWSRLLADQLGESRASTSKRCRTGRFRDGSVGKRSEASNSRLGQLRETIDFSLIY